MHLLMVVAVIFVIVFVPTSTLIVLSFVNNVHSKIALPDLQAISCNRTRQKTVSVMPYTTHSTFPSDCTRTLYTLADVLLIVPVLPKS